jgi:long-chain fatty acid transport protein
MGKYTALCSGRQLYAANDKLTLRGGVAFDETPIPNASLRTPRIADEDRIWVAVGATYAVSDHLSFDLGYTHLFVDDPEIDYVSNFPNTPHAGDSSLLRGQYDASVDIISAQVNVAF